MARQSGPNSFRTVVEAFQQICRGDIQCIGQALDYINAGSVAAPLKRAHIGPINPCSIGEFLLGQACRAPGLT
ncbi:hypothetical protein GCM10009424_26000 [Sphingomonas ursincola]